MTKTALFSKDLSELFFRCGGIIFAFDEGERKPNFALWFSIAGVLCTVIGRKIHIPLRLQKCAPRLNFVGACPCREAGTIRSQETFFHEACAQS